MARQRTPVCKLCRREGVKLFLKGERCFTPKCAVDPNRKPYPPGGNRLGRRRRPSDYAVQLRGKQKVKRMYGLLERQFRRHFREASRRPGATGENLLRILEMRLDNAVYRLGFAESRAQARQLVQHGHFDVDGRKTDIPSFVCEVGNAISVRSRSRQLEYFKQMAEDLDSRVLTGWLSRDVATLSGRVVSMPLRSDIDPTLEEQLIVEYYSR